MKDTRCNWQQAGLAAGGSRAQSPRQGESEGAAMDLGIAGKRALVTASSKTLVASRKLSAQAFTESFSALAMVIFTTLSAPLSIISPVAGLRT